MTATQEYAKKSVTIPRDVLTEVDKVIGDTTFSAYVTDALRRQIQHDKLAEVVEDFAQAGIIPTEAEYRQAMRDMTT